MGSLIVMNRGTYSNENVVENVIRYITRTRKKEDRQHELYGYGGVGVTNCISPEIMIAQIKYIQKIHGIDVRGGRRMYHETFSLCDKEFESLHYDFSIVNLFAMECCQEYFLRGHQAIYAVHFEPDKKLHIHFAVNTINFIDGKKWRSYMRDRSARDNKFNDILRRYIYQLNSRFELVG